MAGFSDSREALQARQDLVCHAEPFGYAQDELCEASRSWFEERNFLRLRSGQALLPPVAQGEASLGSIEETAKQIIGVAGILEGLYFHAIAYSDIRGQLRGVGPLLLYLLPLLLWLVSLLAALLVFFPRAYASNIGFWRESKTAFERIVTWKHNMLKAADLFLFLGALALFAAMGAYLAG